MPPEGMVENERMTLERIDTVISPLKDAGRIDKLRIVLIDGPAGVGKTFLVRRFLIQRAGTILPEKVCPLFCMLIVTVSVCQISKMPWPVLFKI